ncbi:aldolase/citrate lyase family protein [Burkholderia sp. IMCC1007]|uniref:aldolase/citrate lyase family protein n=1 Tax=Burkholderia sp. IMCC1007 TaxID=3004104 RepID=UPI0022B3D9AD|nr:aldolase/citrate lyase family protein [Burkholderia sp. IMCC1007]
MTTHDDAVTYLFVPGDRPERFEKAVRSGADVVIVDLEDAVAPSAKPAARRARAEAWTSLSALAHETGVALCPRINGLRDAASGEDLALCQALKPALVMVPKVESATEPVNLQEIVPSECDAPRARDFGFTAKLCIHPKQIGAVDAAFNVTDDELAWAGRVVAASEASEGAATTVDDVMVDAPVLLRARRVIARHAGQQRRTAT